MSSTRDQPSSLSKRYDEALSARKRSGLWRELPTARTTGIDFTHNDYLGLSQHPEIIAAVEKAAHSYGTGGRASRLLGAQAELTRELESEIACSKSETGNSTALVFPGGYQLNAGVVSTLLNKSLLGCEPLVFADRLIHASLHHGIALAGARQHRFNHNDTDHLETLLKKHDDDRPKFVFIESIYGMDGDVAPLKKFYSLKSQYGFHLYVDEAHATGVAGEQGFGLCKQHDSSADIVIGTFSKAIGSAGGYIVCPPDVRSLIVNHCSAFIYSTAISPVASAAALAAWKLLPDLDSQRDNLNGNADRLRTRLMDAGYDTGCSTTHIVPVIIGNEEEAAGVKKQLADADIHVSLIRPPTVPPGTARLRIGVSASHSTSDIDLLTDAMCQKRI